LQTALGEIVEQLRLSAFAARGREPPFFFLKPADTVVDDGAALPDPPETENFQYGIEPVTAIGRGETDISIEHALDHVFGYAVSIDLTWRDLQLAAREQGRPWDWGKASICPRATFIAIRSRNGTAVKAR
jgi:2-keto-4-pentenoate hydratase/2-oxohepta-3-ene-1,7-dioic acid hydratase in catechol pathway